MCDCIAALAGSTAGGRVIFGKNSDREPAEAQAVECMPAAEHEAGGEVRCTYIAIPQARRTHATLICRPTWMWGAEMGANEHGLAIGNEAVHAKVGAPKEPALLGMDLVRLGLERAASAAEAIEVITDLLGRWGQGGNCGLLIPSYYNNSFLIVDPADAYVLETVGRDWLVERIRDMRSLSNAYDIASPERSSFSLSALAVAGEMAGERSCADAIADRSLDLSGRRRRARSAERLSEREGALAVADMMSILRDHGPPEAQDARGKPSDPTIKTICMHATREEPRGQTVGSLVSELDAERPVHWVTGTSGPCSSIFKPVVVGVPLPPEATELEPDGQTPTLWREHEPLLKAFHEDADVDGFATARDNLEASFRERMRATLAEKDRRLVGGSIAACWREAAVFERRWTARRSRPKSLA